VQAEGLEFHVLRPDVDPFDPTVVRRVLDKKKGPEYVIRDVFLAHVRSTFEDLRASLADADLLVNHPMLFAGQLAARASGKLWASVALSPVSLFSTRDPPVFPGLPFEDRLAGLGPSFQRALLWAADRQMSRWLSPYRQLERELGLPSGPNPILKGQHSPQLVLALFSVALAAPQPDWPTNTIATGFAFFQQADELAPEVRAFLDAGEPPLVFTLGSAASASAGRFYQHSVEAATKLGERALLLTGRESGNLPSGELAPTILSVPYAPYAAVFSRAKVIVHQCGAGTTGEAMRAGRPMLVVPFGQDQPDHARRLRRLGVAIHIPAARYDSARAARALSQLTQDAGWAERARNVAERVRAERGVEVACDAIERLLSCETG
jgi:UDP:flavonoid glycosyltransferase YjiC (YdhE family)